MNISAEIQVNSHTANDQKFQQITALSDGGWVITWESENQDGSGQGVYAQSYNANGDAQRSETQVNSHPANDQQFQQITALSGGGWVITWESENQDGSGRGVYAQAYDANGDAQGGETQVNTHTAGNQVSPQITGLSDGGWVITWESENQDGSGRGVYAQAYDANGDAQERETQVNTHTADFQGGLQITALNDGGWVTTWWSLHQDGPRGGVYAQAYDTNGDAQGSETQVNTHTADFQGGPQIAALSDGGWVITWWSLDHDGSGWGAYAQAYDANGDTRGSETQVNTHTADFQGGPQIAALNDGGWVITWLSPGQDGDGWGAFAQAYDANGDARGSETQVNTHTADFQGGPQIAALSDGGWVITWWSLDQDGSGWGTYAQAYDANGDARGGETQVNTHTADFQRGSQITALNDGGWVITWMSRSQDGDGWGVYSRSFENLATAGGDETIDGTAAADTITFTSLSTTVNAGEGANTITGTSGNNLIMAGVGADTITITSGTNIIEAGGGANTITATKGDNTITSGSGADTITVTSGTNTIHAGEGANTITATSGGNTITTGSGADTITVTSGNNTIHAGDGANTIVATSGINTITSGSGADTITTSGSAGGGNTIDAGDVADKITSGSDCDADADTTTTDGLAGGSNTINACDGANPITSGSGADTSMTGGSAGGGNTIDAGDGANTITTGGGNDTITAGNGVDTITTGGGDDVINAGGGNDIMTGGAGSDVFIFEDGFGNDSITDFDAFDSYEVIILSNVTSIANYTDLTENYLIANASGDAVIFDGADTITLIGVSIADLDATDFIF